MKNSNKITEQNIKSIKFASELMLKVVEKMIKNKEHTDLGLYLEGTAYELIEIVEKLQ